MCLFDVLRELQEELELKLYAVHVNHQFRPGAAEEDQKYVEELCIKLNIPCYSYTVDCNALAKAEGLTSEEAGRKARYDSFARVALELVDKGISKEDIAIALAHNANDQCETILFRIMRGTGTDGLSGIPYKRLDENGFTIVRPILDLNREEIEKYCEERKLSPRIDHTNNENLYARNKIRNLLIPYIEENFNESIIETVNRLGKVAQRDKEYLHGEAMRAYEKALIDEQKAGAQVLDLESLLSLHHSIRFRVYTVALEKLGLEQNITYAQGENIDKILVSKSPSAMCDLTGGFTALREYNRVVFRQGSTNFDKHPTDKHPTGKHPTDKHATDSHPNWKLFELSRDAFEEYKKTNSTKTFGAFSGVQSKDLSVRTRKAGDKINTGNGTKKIQDFFVDQKVPKSYRDEALLLAKGSDVLWVLPSDEFLTESMRTKGRFSAEFKALDNPEGPIIILEKL